MKTFEVVWYQVIHHVIKVRTNSSDEASKIVEKKWLEDYQEME